MRKIAFFVSVALAFAAGARAVAARYASSQFPQTAAVVQILYDDAVRQEQSFKAYARKAHQEDAEKIESLFAALASSQNILVDNHKSLLRAFDLRPDAPAGNGLSVGGTRSNLEITANIALAKIEQRFEALVGMIRAEGNAEVIAAVEEAWKVKTRQLEFVKDVSNSLGWIGLEPRSAPGEYYVCRMCGNMAAVVPFDKCSACGAEPRQFEEVTPRWRVCLAIEDNGQLTPDEREYAKRFFQVLCRKGTGPVAGSAAAGVYGTAAYRKWGLGEPRAFADAEMVYIASLADMAAAWERYGRIDLGNLTPDEKQYLARMHDKYGEGAIDLTSRRQGGDFSEAMTELLDLVAVLSGSDLLYDVDIIFLKRTMAASK